MAGLHPFLMISYSSSSSSAASTPANEAVTTAAMTAERIEIPMIATNIIDTFFQLSFESHYTIEICWCAIKN